MTRTLTSLLLCLATASAALAQAPAIGVTPARVDFGTLKVHDVRQQDVVIKNNGGGILEIMEVESTCGCTVAELAKKELKPGESTTLAVEFSAKEEFQGPQNKHVTIVSNDPVHASFDLVVTADVKVPLYSDSGTRALGFPSTKVGQPVQEVWTFWTEEVPALQMSVASKPDWLDIAIANGVDGDKRKSRVTFTVRGDTKAGRPRGTVTLGTNVPGEAAYVIQVAAHVSYDLVLGVDRVAFNYVQPEQPLSTRLRVGTADKNTRFKLTRAEVDVPGLTARVENTIVGQEGQVYVEGKALPRDNPLVTRSNGRVKGTLKVYTDLPSTPVMEIEVSYMIRL